MAVKCIDYIGQEIVVGDWAAVTQNNTIYVGKVIKAGKTVTIAIDSIDEFILTDSKFKRASGWEERRDIVRKKFGQKTNWFRRGPDWARDGKFIKITPTEKMLAGYDV
jgi:hypothetical protein